MAVSVTATVQFSASPSSAHHPGIGVKHCFLSAPLYLHLVAGPLLLANLFFFVDTARNLCCGLWRPLTRNSRDGDDLNHSGVGDRGQRSSVVFRMFFAMGIPWTGEVISWIIKGAFGVTHWTLLISGVFNIANASQGIFIFAVIFFDSKTLDEIRLLFRRLFSDKKVRNEELSVSYHNESSKHHHKKNPNQQRSKSLLPSSPVTLLKSSDEEKGGKKDEGTKCQKTELESAAAIVVVASEENVRRNA